MIYGSTEKCSVIKLCRSMDKAIDGRQNGHSAGLNRFIGVSKDLETYLMGVAYCNSSKDPGIFVNFCPWCGSDLRVTGPHPSYTGMERTND